MIDFGKAWESNDQGDKDGEFENLCAVLKVDVDEAINAIPYDVSKRPQIQSANGYNDAPVAALSAEHAPEVKGDVLSIPTPSTTNETFSVTWKHAVSGKEMSTSTSRSLRRTSLVVRASESVS